jgi:hypothetical protein
VIGIATMNFREETPSMHKHRNLRFWKFPAWILCGLVLPAFAVGVLVAFVFAHIESVRADANRVFELRVYHTVPGKLAVMESRFRDTTSKLLAKHHLNVLGYWTAEEASGSRGTFVFLLAHENQEEAKKNWDAMRMDPEFQAVMKAEQTEKTLEKADIVLMHPTDFSAMK